MSGTKFETVGQHYQSTPTYYALGITEETDVGLLEFEVELAFGGTAFSNFPSFHEFVERATSRHGRRRLTETDLTRTWSDLGTSYQEQSSRGFGTEKRTVRWMESIPRPQPSEIDDFGGEEREEPEERGFSGKLYPSKENQEEKEVKDEESAPEDPTMSTTLIRGGDSAPVIRQQRTRRRIFTIVESGGSPTFLERRKGASVEEPSNEVVVQNPPQPPASGGFSRFVSGFSKRVVPIGIPAVEVRREEQDQTLSRGYFSSPKRRHKSVVCNVEEKMRIMAYLGSFDQEYDVGDEHLLFEITLVNGRLLKFAPDFAQPNPIVVRSRHGQYTARLRVKEPERHQFDDILTAEDKGLLERGETKEEEQIEEAIEEETGEYVAFEVPEADDYWLLYQISIDAGLNFPHNGSIHIEYAVDLPRNVRALRPEELVGRSQACCSKGEERDDVVHFSHVTELALAYSSSQTDGQNPTFTSNDENLGVTVESSSALCWPRLLLRVLSEDGWGRLYVDGYSSLALPANPGIHSFEVNCWRPVEPQDHWCALRERHLGQAVDLAEFKFVGASGIANSGIYSRRGICTESSGKLSLTVQCLHQCRQYIAKDVLRSMQYGTIVQRTGISESLHWRITKVLEEFEQARRQFIRLRAKKLIKFVKN